MLWYQTSIRRFGKNSWKLTIRNEKSPSLSYNLVMTFPFPSISTSSTRYGACFIVSVVPFMVDLKTRIVQRQPSIYIAETEIKRSGWTMLLRLDRKQIQTEGKFMSLFSQKRINSSLQSILWLWLFLRPQRVRLFWEVEVTTLGGFKYSSWEKLFSSETWATE